MITIRVGGVEATLIALRNTTVSLQTASDAAFGAAGAALKAAVKQNISLRDHTLADLAKLDHPYAVRHGSIRIHRRKPWQVHAQSGVMLNALRGRPITQGAHGYEVTFDYNIAPHAAFVIQGTKVMLPRDVLWRTAQDPQTQKAMMKRIVMALGKGLRSKMGVRFGGGSPLGAQGYGGGFSSVR